MATPAKTAFATLPRLSARAQAQHTMFVKIPKHLFLAYKNEVHLQGKTIRDDLIAYMEHAIRQGPTWRETLRGLGVPESGRAGRPRA